jgi:hypothetical protein
MDELGRARRRASWLAICAVTALLSIQGPATTRAAQARSPLEPSSVPTGCTVVYAADGQSAVGGNNEDERNPLTRIWFVPGERGGYGSAFVGYDDLVIQGGMNEAGLFFDGLAVRSVDVPARPGKPTYTGQSFFRDVLADCDSVACVREKLESVSMPGTWNGQTLFGDRFGQSTIFEPLTLVPKSGSFQVATNFFQSEVPPAERTDERYITATGMLAAADHVSTGLVRKVLDATHQEGTVNTVYSTVYDLKTQTIHLYYFHDFANVVTFDLRAELGKGLHGFEIPTLFGSNQAGAAVAAPIRDQVAAAVARLAPVPVDRAAVAALAGTFEATPAVTLLIQADEHGLSARQPWTPWVPLVALSPTEFARVFSDPEGAIHQQGLRFTVGGPGQPAQVEITEAGQSIVATRVARAESGIGWPAILGLVASAVAVAGVVLWTLARPTRRRRTASTPPPAAPAPPRHSPTIGPLPH